MEEKKTTAKQRADQRRYQARKDSATKVTALEARVTKLEAENAMLVARVTKLEADNAKMMAFIAEQ